MYGTVLIHHGIKGQKWGVRRFQNEDGTLTVEGEHRYTSNRDSEMLANSLATHTNAVMNDRKNTKSYVNSSTGNRILLSDKKYQREAIRTKNKYEKLKSLLQKKYDYVLSKSYVDDNGKATLHVVLEKNGNKYVSELETDYAFLRGE